WHPVGHKSRHFICTHLDSSTPALAHSIRHCSTGRVNHGHEANKAQVLSGEVHIISVKLKSLRKLIIREKIMTESYKAKASPATSLCEENKRHEINTGERRSQYSSLCQP
uniref:Uncharacterized protein n=1 Tax=Scleropages formosus TaxID=113540 RepID=A0A8C9RJV2_SCLFO